mgnify:CR=1 FL=1
MYFSEWRKLIDEVLRRLYNIKLEEAVPWQVLNGTTTKRGSKNGVLVNSSTSGHQRKIEYEERTFLVDMVFSQF